MSHRRSPGPFKIRNTRILDPHSGVDEMGNLVVSADGVRRLGEESVDVVCEFDGTGLWAVPGLVDLQVHFRQPGFEYKETIESGSKAAFAGGVTTAVVMPNTHPALDTPEQVRFESEESERVGGIRILVGAAVTPNLEGRELTDHGALKGAGAVAVTDDGLPVMSDSIMEASLQACVEHDLLFMQHAEDLSMTHHAPMTESDVSREIGVQGQPASAEGVMVERDIALAEKTGARYHVLHTTTGRSLEAVRRAKAKGLPISCEVSPHHLLLTYEACRGAEPNTKMNPPLRSEQDRLALVQALVDGTADAVATDHAPHSAEEKAKSFTDAPFGVVGLETMLAAVMRFVHSGTISAGRAIELMTSGPARVLRQEGRLGALFSEGAPADLCLIDPNREWTVGDATLHGKSRNSAFLGETFQGKVVATFFRGELRFDEMGRD